MAMEEIVIHKNAWKNKHLRWICALANSQGGKLIVGAGGEHPSELADHLRDGIRSTVGIRCKAKAFMEMGDPSVAILVPESKLPVSCDGKYYVIADGGLAELRGMALDRFLLARRGLRWDSLPAPSATLGDLSPESLEHFRELAYGAGRVDRALLTKPDRTLLERLHLLVDSRLTNAAMLLFGADPERWQPGVYMKIGYFGNDPGVEFEDEVRGPLIRQVEQAMDLLSTRYLTPAGVRSHGHSLVRFPVSMTALQELLVNAVAHKDYASAVPVRIRVSSEEGAQISNRAVLPKRWNADEARAAHASDPPNPSLAHVLYLAGLADMWGSGLENARQSSLAVGAPQPAYTMSLDTLVATLPPRRQVETGVVTGPFGGDAAEAPSSNVLPASQIEHSAAKDAPVEPVLSKSFAQFGACPEEALSGDEAAASPDSAALTDKIIEILRVAPKTTYRIMAEKLDLSVHVAGEYLRRLKAEGRICRVGSARTGFWKVLD